MSRLKGEARNLILPELSSTVLPFKTIVFKLKNRFVELDNLALSTALLQSKRKKEKESILELQQWLRVLGLKALPDELKVSRDRFLLDAFLHLIPDSAQKNYIWEKKPQRL